jgi:hypothetical protein
MKEDNVLAARIARQSQMERAIEYYQMLGKTPTLEDLTLTAHILHKFIVDGWSGDYKELIQKMDGHIVNNY